MLFFIASVFIAVFWGIYFLKYHEGQINNGNGDKVATYAFVWFLFLINMLKIIFCGYLLGFHIMVRWKGLTTYKYVLKNREKKVKILNSKTEALKKLYNEVMDESSSNARISIKTKTLEEIIKESERNEILRKVLHEELQEGVGYRMNTEEWKRNLRHIGTIGEGDKKDRQSMMYKISRSKFLTFSNNDTNHEEEEQKFHNVNGKLVKAEDSSEFFYGNSVKVSPFLNTEKQISCKRISLPSIEGRFKEINSAPKLSK